MKICPACGNRNNRDAAKRCDQCGEILPVVISVAPARQPKANSRRAVAVNRTRRFVLPGVQELTREQDLANELPAHGRHLLIGGPGTGKSVIALLRAGRLQRSGKPHAFLAYNQLLIHYCKALAPQQIKAATWISWFKENWREQWRQSCPVRGKPWEIDWEAIMDTLGQADAMPSPPTSYLVVDEGQDMPKEFYWALSDLGYEHIFVAADFNQVLHPGQHSNRQELIDALDKSPRMVLRADAPREKLFNPSAIVELRHNHRNSGPVARLAAHICRTIANPQSPCTELRDDMRNADVPLLFGYEQNDERRNLQAVCRHILVMADRNPRWLIGVLCPTQKIRDDYKTTFEAALRNIRHRLDFGDPTISIFDSGQKKQPDFTQGGIVILTAQSCKGLEFEVVIIADLHWYRNEASKHLLLYVMVSRAIERVILLRNLALSCPIDAILPQDPDLLKRDP